MGNEGRVARRPSPGCAPRADHLGAAIPPSVYRYSARRQHQGFRPPFLHKRNSYSPVLLLVSTSRGFSPAKILTPHRPRVHTPKQSKIAAAKRSEGIRRARDLPNLTCLVESGSYSRTRSSPMFLVQPEIDVLRPPKFMKTVPLKSARARNPGHE